jgi:hypothetical protein
MNIKLSSMAVGIGLALLSAAPSMAQVQLNVCGAPPLPPCQPQVQERRVIIEREGRGSERLGTNCRTRTLRCSSDPRPVGSRCTCEDDEGEDVVGRIR